MKLAQYTTAKISLVLFLLIGTWGAFFYFAMVHEIMDETDDELRSYRNIIIRRATAHSLPLGSEESIFYRYSIQPISREDAKDYQESWEDTEEFFPLENEHIPMRVYKSVFQADDGLYYELDLRISTTERDDLLQSLFFYLIMLYLLLLICIFVSITILLKRSFSPLQKLLLWLKNVTPDKPIPPLENETAILEFQSLNDAAVSMSRRNAEMYEEQKQFIENASHELQTPLAVALSKLELLAEDENITEQQLIKIAEISKPLYQAARLNKSLLLLTRIDNNQYRETYPVNMLQLVEEIFTNLKEITEYKNISVILDKRNKCIVKANELLAQILLSNLIKNAVIHTEKNGQIHVIVDSGSLSIWNSGTFPLDSSKIFKRFYHNGQNKNSTGLGLAIVRSIANLYSIKIFYCFEDGHLFLLEFPKKS